MTIVVSDAHPTSFLHQLSPHYPKHTVSGATMSGLLIYMESIEMNAQESLLLIAPHASNVDAFKEEQVSFPSGLNSHSYTSGGI